MRRRRCVTALASLVCLLVLGGSADAANPDAKSAANPDAKPSAKPNAKPGDRQLVSTADQALFLALSRGNTAAIGRLLDPKFTWTDAEGRTLGAKAVLKGPPKPGAQVGANLTLHLYGDVAVMATELEHIHALRVWVKGNTGWRALLYQEVKVAESPPSAAKRIEADCDNPCRTIPYIPRTAAERDVIASWQGLERAVAKGDGTAWATHVADEFTVVTADRVQDKATRTEAVGRGGSAPAPLVSASLFDFTDAVVMSCLHQPYVGKPVHVTRVWVKREGAWVLAVSYQTVVQAAKVG
jgi:hypothetical protein